MDIELKKMLEEKEILLDYLKLVSNDDNKKVN